MSTHHPDIAAIGADFLRDHLVPPLRCTLASDTRADAGAVGMRAHLDAWLDELQAGRAEAALEPERLARALEALWKLGIMYLLAPPDPVDPEQVDVAMRPEYVAALDVAVAAVTALDTMRGGAVIAAFGRAQRATVEQFAALVAAKTGVPGAA